jgi:hypothetical protein
MFRERAALRLGQSVQKPLPIIADIVSLRLEHCNGALA